MKFIDTSLCLFVAIIIYKFLKGHSSKQTFSILWTVQQFGLSPCFTEPSINKSCLHNIFTNETVLSVNSFKAHIAAYEAQFLTVSLA